MLYKGASGFRDSATLYFHEWNLHSPTTKLDRDVLYEMYNDEV